MSYSAALRSANPGPAILVDQDDSPVSLEFGRRYEVGNAGAAPASDIDLDLPTQTPGDRGKKIFIHVRYVNNPRDTVLVGHGVLKRGGSDTFKGNFTTLTSVDLTVNDDNIIAVADGAGEWTFE